MMNKVTIAGVLAIGLFPVGSIAQVPDEVVPWSALGTCSSQDLDTGLRVNGALYPIALAISGLLSEDAEGLPTVAFVSSQVGEMEGMLSRGKERSTGVYTDMSVGLPLTGAYTLTSHIRVWNAPEDLELIDVAGTTWLGNLQSPPMTLERMMSGERVTGVINMGYLIFDELTPWPAGDRMDPFVVLVGGVVFDTKNDMLHAIEGAIIDSDEPLQFCGAMLSGRATIHAEGLTLSPGAALVPGTK